MKVIINENKIPALQYFPFIVKYNEIDFWKNSVILITGKGKDRLHYSGILLSDFPGKAFHSNMWKKCHCKLFDGEVILKN